QAVFHAAVAVLAHDQLALARAVPPLRFPGPDFPDPKPHFEIALGSLPEHDAAAFLFEMLRGPGFDGEIARGVLLGELAAAPRTAFARSLRRLLQPRLFRPDLERGVDVGHERFAEILHAVDERGGVAIKAVDADPAEAHAPPPRRPDHVEG